MAFVQTEGDQSNSAVDPALNQSILQQNYNAYVGSGGNPSNYSLSSSGVFSAGTGSASATNNPYGLLAAAGYGGGGGYAPYDVGDGQTKWDEFVQQMQLEQQKLQQAQEIENARLAQEKQLQEEQLAQNQKIADQNTVEAFNKNLMDMKGPADPYGYLFASRGLAAPQGYAPTPMPLPDAVKNSYQSQGVDLATAQQQLSGSSGPSFINGYLGGMPSVLQQGPMGFQNNPQNSNTPPGSQSGSGSGQPSGNSQPSGSQPTQMSKGGTIPGYAPGKDTVPAQLSPGEGVLTPQAVQMLGGPAAIQQLNSQAVQHFATGGMVQPPLYQQQLTDLGNGLLQRGFETGTIRGNNPYTAAYDAANTGVPIRDAPGGNIFGQTAFNQQGGFNITGAPVQGPNNFAPNDVNGSTMWYPVQLANGQTGYISAYDLQGNGFTMPVTGNAFALDPNLPQGFQLQSPGVATRSDQNAPPAPTSGDWMKGEQARSLPAMLSNSPMLNATQPAPSQPLGPQPAQQPQTASSAGPVQSPVMLTGGVINPTGPVNGPPMN